MTQLELRKQQLKEHINWCLKNGLPVTIRITSDLLTAIEVLESIAAEKCNPPFDETLPKLERGSLISIIDTDTKLAREALEQIAKAE